MPTYVYRCEKCEHQFETLQRISEDPIKDCPKCEGKVTRILFPVGIVFKGSGFHVNDYPSSSLKSATSSTNSKSETSSEAKSETKKEAATASKD